MSEKFMLLFDFTKDNLETHEEYKKYDFRNKFFK